MRHSWIVAALIVGCSSGGGVKDLKDPAVEPVAPSCRVAAAHFADLAVGNLEPRPPDDAVNTLIEMVRVRCDKDAWSADAQQCFSQMKTVQDFDTCGTKLTEAQTKALLDEQAARAPANPKGKSGESGLPDGGSENKSAVDPETERQGGR